MTILPGTYQSARSGGSPQGIDLGANRPQSPSTRRSADHHVVPAERACYAPSRPIQKSGAATVLPSAESRSNRHGRSSCRSGRGSGASADGSQTTAFARAKQASGERARRCLVVVRSDSPGPRHPGARFRAENSTLAESVPFPPNGQRGSNPTVFIKTCLL
jgi:hypothetical protein